jgi:hypothetical protein
MFSCVTVYCAARQWVNAEISGSKTELKYNYKNWCGFPAIALTWGALILSSIQKIKQFEDLY